MKKNVPFICVLALSLAATILLATGSDACDGVPFMAAATACHKALSSAAGNYDKKSAMFELCMKMLKDAPPGDNKATIYAHKAAVAARDYYDTTEHAIDNDLTRGNASLSGDLRAAYSACTEKNSWSDFQMTSMMVGMEICSLDVGNEYLVAIAGIDNCAHNLRRAGVPPSSPLYGMVLADRDNTLVASLLAGLLATNKTTV